MIIDLGDRTADEVRSLNPSLFRSHELRQEVEGDVSGLPEKVWVLGLDNRTLNVLITKSWQFRAPAEGETARMLVKKII